MKVFLDDFIFSLQRIGGISVYWSNFLAKCREHSDKVALISRNDSRSILSEDDFWGAPTMTESRLPLSLARIFPLLMKLPPKALFHSSYLRYSAQKNVCNIVTIHDLAAELGVISGWRRYLKSYLQRNAIKHASGIICVSESTRKSLLEVYPFVDPGITTVIHHGFPDKYYPASRGSSKKILFVGSRKGYKNFEVCLEVLKGLKDFELILAGGGELSDSEKKKLKKACAGRYRHHNYVSSEKLNSLYNDAFCLLYPSRYEGFGMPVIEAMQAGCPPVCAANNAIKEIAGDAAVLIQNFRNPQQYIDAILLLKDEATRQKVIEKGFEKAKEYSMELNFRKTWSFYEYIYHKRFGERPEVLTRAY